MGLWCLCLVSWSVRPSHGQSAALADSLVAIPVTQLIIVSDPPDQTIVFDGSPLATPTPTTLDVQAGKHTIAVSGEGYQTLTSDVIIAGGQRLEVRFHLLRVRPRAPTPAELRAITFPEGLGPLGQGTKAEDEARIAEVREHNASCVECHPAIPKLHDASLHKVISCAECHAPYSEHVRKDGSIREMPVVRGGQIQILCLSCHEAGKRSRFAGSIKTVPFPRHIRDKGVSTNNSCQQCHHVHSPRKWVDEARQMVGAPERMATIPLLNEEVADRTQRQLNALTETFVVFPLSLGIAGKIAFSQDDFPGNELLISGALLVGGSYFLGKTLYSRKVSRIEAINAERAAYNLRAQEHNQRSQRAMSDYHRALRQWEGESRGRGIVTIHPQ